MSMVRPDEAPKRPQAKAKIGAKVFDYTGKDDERKGGVEAADVKSQGIAHIVNHAHDQKKRLYNGDPLLAQALDMRIDHITGNRYMTGQTVARCGFLGLLAKRLPRPVLWDAEDLLPVFSVGGQRPTACVDGAGRMWIYAPFFRECYDEDLERRAMSVPLLLHEYSHTALEHTRRMRNFDPQVSNIAQDTVINPMVRKFFSAGTVFSPMFERAWGNRPEDKRFTNLAEETIAKILQSEWAQRMQDKGVIHIKKLVIEDGKVTKQTVLAAGKDEKKELGTVTVKVEDRGDHDVADTDFDCAKLIIDEIENKLAVRKRPGGGSAPKSSKSPIEIPVMSDNPMAGMLNDGDNPFNGGQAPQDGLPQPGQKNAAGGATQPQHGDVGPRGVVNGHLVDMEKLKEALAERGYGHVLDDIRANEFDERGVERVIEQALKEASEEAVRVGAAYPGAHMTDYIKEVVKPALAYTISWQRRVREFLTGQGSLMTRSMDELSALSFVDPEDMGLEEDDWVALPGQMPQKADGRVGIIVDTSGSVDDQRLFKFLSFAVSVRASKDDLAPDVDIYPADTVVRGAPTQITEDSLEQAISQGVPIGGRGGTDFVVPINQLMKYAQENDIEYAAVLYVTDFGCGVPPVETLPADLPPLMFLGVPQDYAAAQAFVTGVREYAEVVMIDKNMEIDLTAAEDKAEIRGDGLKMRP